MNKRTKWMAAGLLLACILSGCSSKSTVETSETADFTPVSTLTPGMVASESVAVITDTESQTGGVASEALPVDITAAPATEEPEDISEEPETEPTDTPEPTEELFTYSLIPISDRSMGFIFAYPEGWVNLPGKSTICYRENVEYGDFPARVAVVKKSVAHTPKATKVFSEFQSFANTIAALYDSDTFEYIDQNADVTFMDQKAYETYYLGYSGDIEIKGYMIACGIDVGSSHYIVIYHFCASYEDFDKMSTMMKQMRDTVTF